jgi:hypothetical protein
VSSRDRQEDRENREVLLSLIMLICAVLLVVTLGR